MNDYPSAPPPPYSPQYASDAREFKVAEVGSATLGGLQYPGGPHYVPGGLQYPSTTVTEEPTTITVIAYDPPKRGCRCVRVLLIVLFFLVALGFLSNYVAL